MSIKSRVLSFAGPLVLVATCLPGCISYRLDLLPPAPELSAPPLSNSRPSLVYSVKSVAGGDLANGGLGSLPGFDLTTPADELGAMLQRSGWFRSVQPAAEGREGDVQLDVVLTANRNDVVVLVSMCTLTLIPMWRTVTWDLTAEARTRAGGLYRYELQDAARDVFWLPIILGMSFRPWGEAYREVRDNMYRTLLARLHDDGLLAPVAAP